MQDRASEVMRRCDILGAISEDPGRLTRTFGSEAMAQANTQAGEWMREAGLKVKVDAALNLLGRWESPRKDARTLLLGSHLDTVRDAGKFDGPLGVMVALAAVEELRAHHVTLPFHVEIVGFSDEEGVRYQTTYLGSRALAGTLTPTDLAQVEEKGIEKARRKRSEFLGYAEVHIEQGPVLEVRDLPVGVVSAIAGQSRLRVSFEGMAGHAGTTPMNLRKDALGGAAELVLAAEKCGTLATVGQLEVKPGASNVIPGLVTLTLDVRDQKDARRKAAVRKLENAARKIAARRGLNLGWAIVQETSAVACDDALTQSLAACVKARGLEVLTLPSGAGHDAAALSELCPVAMLFVRCDGGISHNPAESVKTADVAVAVAVLADFLRAMGDRHA